MKLSSLVEYLDRYLGVADHPDYPGALNGLQVDAGRDATAGGNEIRRVAVAVDASIASIRAASRSAADLLVVHHGIFWGGSKPLVGRHGRRIALLFDSRLSLYSSHLPLDSHSETGNCALLCEALGLTKEGRLGSYKDKQIGWWGRTPEPIGPAELVGLLEKVVHGPVGHVPGRGGKIDRVGVVTGSGGGFLEEACNLDLDALVTGEAGHHASLDAKELGIHLLLGGHYATETFGVKAIGVHLEERFGIPYTFIDHPTGF
ncbi:MAG: Nif3-like dinuclear metal center hexameric protein [Gemmatimonadetes bacterium]|nr:Nif3-like dinuclear metal center hexameric protein [Gemmatimonadota bacterium]